MATKPTEDLTWDSNQTNTTTPNATLQSDGYATDEIPTSAEINYWLNGSYLWQQYFEDVTDETLGSKAAFRALTGKFANAKTSGVTGDITGMATNGSGIIVGVCDDGNVVYSYDSGENWSSQTVNGAELYRDVAYRDGLWTLVGDAGVIRTAPDPSGTWTAETSGVATALLGIYDDGTTACVVGASNVILTATDPTGTWTSRTSALAGGTQLNDVVKGGSTWLIVANGGLAQTASDPTSTWTSRTTGVATNLYGAEYGNSVFVVGGAATGGVGTILYSADPTTSFTAAAGNDTTGDVRRGAYNSNSGLWVMTEASGRLAFSGDNQNWLSSTMGSNDVLSAVYDSSVKKINAGGASGDLYVCDDYETIRDDLDVAKSTAINAAVNVALLQATSLTTFTDADVLGMSSTSPGRRLVLGTGSAFEYLITIGTGDDIVTTPVGNYSTLVAGNSWTVQQVGTFRSVGVDDDYAVACGDAGAIYTSPTGGTFNTWTSRTSGTANDLDIVTVGGGYWVCYSSTANNDIVYATQADPTTWAASTSGLDASTNFQDAAFGNGIHVAVTSDGELITTSDPSSGWTTQTLPSNIANASIVRYINDKFVVMDTTATAITTSTDGVNWTYGVATPINFFGIEGFKVGETPVYLGVSNTQNGLYYTTDLVNWTQYPIDGFTTNNNRNHTFFVEGIGRLFLVDSSDDLNFSKAITL